MIGTLLGFLAAHYELVELIYNAITKKQLSKDDAIKAIKDAMVAESDAQMQSELK